MDRPEQEEHIQDEKIGIDECPESEIVIYDLFAVANSWAWLREKADLFISTSQATRQIVNITNLDQKFRKCLSLKSGFKFPVTMEINVDEAIPQRKAFGLDLHYAVVWNPIETNWQALGQVKDERHMLQQCIQEGIEVVADKMNDTATGTKWNVRDTKQGYSSTETLIQVFAEDVDNFHDHFQQQLVKSVSLAIPEISGVEVLLIVGTQGFSGDLASWEDYWFSRKFRSEDFKEVAMSAKMEVCRLGHCLYWDKKDITSAFDSTCSQYYPGFLINCFGKFEWKWTERDHSAASGENVARDMVAMAKGLRAYSQFGKKEWALQHFQQPSVVRLLKGNGPIPSLEKYLERLRMCHDDLDFIKENQSYDSCVKAVMEVDLAVRVVGTDWLDTGFEEAFRHLEEIKEVRFITINEFWRHQGHPVRVILRTLGDIAAANIAEKRMDPGFCAEFDTLQLAAYCEALVCWFVFGNLEPSYSSELGFDIERLADTLQLKPSTFSTRSGLYGHYVEALGFARNAVRIESERLVLANE